VSKIEDEIVQDFQQRLSDCESVSSETLTGLMRMIDEPAKLQVGVIVALIEYTTGESVA
jgi:hypothetical protein